MSEATADATSAQFVVGRARMLPRCERILNEWNISAMDMVRNAIVVPCALSVIAQVPVSMKCPTK